MRNAQTVPIELCRQAANSSSCYPARLLHKKRNFAFFENYSHFFKDYH